MSFLKHGFPDRYSLTYPSKPVVRFLLCCTTMLSAITLSLPSHADAIVEYSIGEGNICVLTESGSINCRNNPLFTRGEVPADLPPMIAVSAGQQHTCGITETGDARCWLGNEEIIPLGLYDQLNIPELDAPLVSLSTGANHTCAIDTNNQVQCWGLNTNGQSDPPNDADGFLKVSASVNYTCGIRTSGEISCWSTDQRYTQTEGLVGPFVDLDTALFNACGLTVNGDIECWAGAILPPSNGPYTDLSVNTGMVCGLDSNLKLDCVASSRRPNLLDEIPADTMFTSIESTNSAGYERSPDTPNLSLISNGSCGLTIDGELQCWGSQLLPTPQGTAEPESFDVSELELSVTARHYGPGDSIELFWNLTPQVIPPINIEVYRDDTLIATTDAQYSYFDSESGGNNSVNYKIRPVDSLGNTGPFSTEITVNKSEGTVTGTPNGDNTNEAVDLITNTQFRRLENTTIFISWSKSPDMPSDFTGFQLRRNGKVLKNTQETIYFEDFTPISTPCDVITIVALATDNHILDFENVVPINSANSFTRNCD